MSVNPDDGGDGHGGGNHQDDHHHDALYEAHQEAEAGAGAGRMTPSGHSRSAGQLSENH